MPSWQGEKGWFALEEGRGIFFADATTFRSRIVRYHDNTTVFYYLYGVLWFEPYLLCFVDAFQCSIES
jgi:hypothetical protein